METRICNECGIEQPIENFEKRRGVCRKCRGAYRKRLRQANPELHNTWNKAALKRKTAWLWSLKTSCIICGESTPCCLDFHHIDPNEKEFTIGKYRSRSNERILNEIKNAFVYVLIVIKKFIIIS